MKISVRKIGSRWQPVDGAGNIIRGDVYNADGGGYSTKEGAHEAAGMLRHSRAWKPMIGAHAAKRAPASNRSAWPSVVGSHDLGTADVRTGDGAYWIVTVPTGYRVDYKPWGPSHEVELGTFPSRQRARAKIAEHADGR